MSASLRNRPKCCAAVNRRDVPQAAVSRCSEQLSYSITSSAMASSPGGKLRPNALAVLRYTKPKDWLRVQTAEPILGRDRGALLKERPLARLDPPRPSRSRCIIGKASVLSFAEFRLRTRGRRRRCARLSCEQNSYFGCY